ncbi:MAG: M3 family metallopeptidase [Acidimicrobiia bacterium]
MFDYGSVTPEAITTMTEEAIAESDRLLAEVVSVDGSRTWADTAEPLLQVGRLHAALYGRVPFLGEAHPDPAVRNAARAAEQRLSQWAVATQYRRDLYEAFSAFAADPPAGLTDEQRRWLEFEVRDLRLAGHDLDDEARTELERINTRLAELAIAFASNLAENDDSVDVPIERLDGLAPEIVAGLADGEAPGTKRVTLAYPDVVPALQTVHDRDVRRDLSLVFNRRCVDENRPILEEAVRLRRRVAELFGLPTWAHHKLETRMAGTPERVFAFWDDLVPPLTERGREELAVLEAMLVADGGTPPLMRHDFAYYDERLRRTEYGVDQDEVAGFFELEATMAGLLDLTGEVFGLTYRTVSEAPAWHPDVTLFEVADAAEGRVLGHFYADLHPRDGKFSHAAAFPLLVAHEGPNGWVTPVTAFLCNFPKPSPGRPSLLRHDDVVTLFHEFGHVLHMTLSRATIPRFSGAQTEWDFVEAPSQIMEHWCWDPDVLARFARHHETGEPIPTDLVDRLVAARNVDVALSALRQISLGKLDMGLHGVPEVPDLDAVVAEADAVALVPSTPGTFLPASFGHLFGYDAGYYGYLWAKVFGDDMYSVFAEHGPTDPEVGARYRRTVLEPNGTRDADDLLLAFLGRVPSNEAFLAQLGIGGE